MPDSRGWRCYPHETLDSTSDEARRLLAAGPVPPRFVVWTGRQTRGRGRGSNAWWSDEGSLTFTVGIDPRRELDTPRLESKVAMASAMAIWQVVEPILGREVSVRWPNDVEVDGRKLAGCLVERVETTGGPRLLIGIGLNVATRYDDAPADVRALATSVSDLAPRWAHRSPPRRRCHLILLRLLHWIENSFYIMNCCGSGLMADYNHRDSLRGQRVRIRQGPHVIEGVGEGINPDGSLSLGTAEGPTSIYGGQVLRD